MNFSDFKGDQQLCSKLVSMVDESRVSHAMLFVEKDGQGALALALAMIEYMSKSPKVSRLVHPDVHFSFPVNTNSKTSSSIKPISDHFLKQWNELVLENPYFLEDDLSQKLGIENKVGIINTEEAKSIFRKMNFHSYEGGNKYMIIYLPEKMNVEASNRLLKLVEEPFDDTYFFLITHAEQKIISTIRSRCLRIHLMPLEADNLAPILMKEFSLNSEEALSYARGSGGNYGAALRLVQQQSEQSPYCSLFANILKSCITKDLLSLIKLNEDLSSLGREGQKNFCLYAMGLIRKMYMTRIGAENIAYLTGNEREILTPLIPKISPVFFERAFLNFDKTRKDIEGNVNAKIAFQNLLNILHINS